MTGAVAGQAVAKHLAHKRDLGNVFVASVSSAHGQLRADLRIPTDHPYFNDWAEPHCDLLLWLEASRQAVEVLLHTYENVPLDQQFVIRQLQVGLPTHQVPRAPLHAPDLVFTPQRVRRGSDGLLRLVTGEAIFGQAGRPIGSFQGTLRLLDQSVYEEARSGSRPAATSASPVDPVDPVDPVELGRRDSANVVIANATHRGRCTAASVVVESGHCFFSDHPSDHHSGLALIEAARQVATVSLSSPGQRRSHPPVLVAISADFTRFADIGERIDLCATPISAQEVRVVIKTTDGPVGALMLEFDDASS